MLLRTATTICVLATGLLVGAPAPAWVKEATVAARQALSTSQIQRAPATGTIEVGFSPNKGAEELVLKVLRSAQSEIKLMAYAFTSARVTKSLLEATHRGVRVSVLVDSKSASASKQTQAALSALSTAGAQVRTIDVFPIHHDKVIIIDNQHVQLGSYNYSTAAATKNSENVLVNWSNPSLAKIYEGHFVNNWALAQQFTGNY